jgi:hypothetical protein
MNTLRCPAFALPISFPAAADADQAVSIVDRSSAELAHFPFQMLDYVVLVGYLASLIVSTPFRPLDGLTLNTIAEKVKRP